MSTTARVWRYQYSRLEILSHSSLGEVLDISFTVTRVNAIRGKRSPPNDLKFSSTEGLPVFTYILTNENTHRVAKCLL